MVKPRSGDRSYTASMLKWIFLAIATITFPAAHAQNCGSYKNQLEALLVLPAGKYRVEGFEVATEQTPLIRRNGARGWFDGSKIKDSPEQGGRVTVSAYLDYDLPRIQIKVIDSTTKGRRTINQRLVCSYAISYPALNRQRSLESDVEVSDSGSARFLLPTAFFAIDNDIRNFAYVTSKTGAEIAYGLVSAAVRERDSRSPQLSTTAKQIYAEKLATVQAGENAAAPKYTQLVSECKAILDQTNTEMKRISAAQAAESGGVRVYRTGDAARMSPEYTIESYNVRFRERGCFETNLPTPKQHWATTGAKPSEASGSSADLARPTVKAEDSARENSAQPRSAPSKSPKELCAKEASFLRGMCESMACITPEYQAHPYCATLQSSNR